MPSFNLARQKKHPFLKKRMRQLKGKKCLLVALVNVILDINFNRAGLEKALAQGARCADAAFMDSKGTNGDEHGMWTIHALVFSPWRSRFGLLRVPRNESIKFILTHPRERFLVLHAGYGGAHHWVAIASYCSVQFILDGTLKLVHSTSVERLDALGMIEIYLIKVRL